MQMLDQPEAVRSGEELDAGKIAAYLASVDASLAGVPEIRQFPGGASNLTYLLQYPDRNLVLRRPPFGHKIKSAHDMVREARVMAALKPVYPYVPGVLAICEDPAVLDCDFYVMEQIRGLIPRQELPAGLNLSAEDTRKLCLNVVDKMIELHQVPKATLADIGRGDGYTQRQIEGWSGRYLKAKTADAGSFEAVMAWLKDKMPTADVASCVIHNDFRFDNVVLNPDNPQQVIGVLDWEMATVGDPLMDLGNTLAYWVQADDDKTFQMMRRQPTHLPGMLTRDEVVAYYGEKTGFGVANFDFYTIYGLFRLAVIMQQIYQRFSLGHAKNPVFGSFIHMINYLEKRCLTLIERSKL